MNEGTEVLLAGSASDLEDGDISAAIHWSSSLNGELGIGANLSVILNPGVHTITARVTDSMGKTDTTYVTNLTVNALPVITLLAPDPSARFTADEPVTLSATAVDKEDGDISQEIIWLSSLDSTLGSDSQTSVLLSRTRPPCFGAQSPRMMIKQGFCSK